ncbi:MAG: hypothetical protein JWM86_901, partial [Thermoleophilia bacterium]|nr:hypothetical protein [Thermoleophilia bacterium]
GSASLGTISSGAHQTLTLTVTEGECPTADGDDAVAPDASLDLRFDAVQATNGKA